MTWTVVWRPAALNDLADLWINASDRGLKENFQALDAREVLAKVARLPISRWSYKAAPGQEHIGPVAQDFAAAFNVGPDDKHIATVDANGVALAAIQGLNQVLGEQKEQLQQRDLEIQALKESFFELQRLVLKLTSSQTAQEGQ